MTAVGPGAYNEIRETKLAGTFHVHYSDHLIGMQRFASKMSGCDLYKIQVDGEVGCAAVEYVQEDRLLVKELILSPEKLARGVEAIAARHPAASIGIRTPAFWEGLPGSQIQPFGMIKWYDRELESKWSGRLDAYMGLGFD